MPIPAEVISALIGATSAIMVIVIKDIILDSVRRRSDRKRELLAERLEMAYTPLNYYLYELATRHSNQMALCGEILRIITKYGHLISDRTLSGLYILVDQDELGGFDEEFVKRFFREYRHMKERFYKDRSGSHMLRKAN